MMRTLSASTGSPRLDFGQRPECCVRRRRELRELRLKGCGCAAAADPPLRHGLTLVTIFSR